MAPGDPIRVFVTHAWQESGDYQRVIEMLAGARGFHYQNSGRPELQPAGGMEAARDELRRQIARAEAVIALACMLPRDLALLHFQVVYAKSLDRPVLLLPVFGQSLPELREFAGLVDERLQWDQRAMVDALRRHARQEQVNRWDVVEFKLD